jgi:hypothetical protein
MQHWKAVAGILLALSGAWPSIKWFWDWAGRLDLVRSGGAPVLDALGKIPPWLGLILLALGIFFIVWEIRQLRRAAISAGNNKANETLAAPSASGSSAKEPAPRQTVDFFADRGELNKRTGALRDRFVGHKTVRAILVVGNTLDQAGKIPALKQLLLPHPDGAALKDFQKTIERTDTTKAIRDVTRRLREKGVEVRWYDHFYHQSVLLVDTDQPNGWMHVEPTFPYEVHNDRWCFTVNKTPESEKAIAEMDRIFSKIWNSLELKH